MSEAENDSDKPYEPSQKKLEDARDKGDIPRSNDITTAASYGGFLLAALAFGSASFVKLGSALSIFLDQADVLSLEVFADSSSPFSASAITEILGALVPWILIPALLTLLSILAQRSMVFSTDKIMPKLSRISPIASLGNKFGRSGLFEFGKSFIKLLIYSAILLTYLSQQLPRIIGSLELTPALLTFELLHLCTGLLLLILVVAIVIGTIDLIWQIIEHNRKNMMSRQELIDENKEAEGDPHIKQQRRQKAIEIAMNKMLTEVPKADVIIVNPTHYAVALKWNRRDGRAPVCVAKGIDEIAARIREIAVTSAIPIHSDPTTARALYATIKIGEEIQSGHYKAVAAAIRFAETIRKRTVKS